MKNTTLFYLSQRSDTIDSTPVKLHTAPDAVHARPQHHHVVGWEVDVVFGRAVCQVQVVGTGWPLGRDRVYLPHPRPDVQVKTTFPHYKVSAVEFIHFSDYGLYKFDRKKLY